MPKTKTRELECDKVLTADDFAQLEDLTRRLWYNLSWQSGIEREKAKNTDGGMLASHTYRQMRTALAHADSFYMLLQQIREHDIPVPFDTKAIWL